MSRIVLLSLILLSSLAVSAPRAIAQDSSDPLPGIRGTLYESPTYGYSLVWNPSSWSVTNSESADRLDTLQFEGPAGLAWFWAFDFSGTEDACLDEAIGLVETAGIFDTFIAFFGDDGEPVRGMSAGAFGSVVSAKYLATWTDNAGQSTESTVDIWCSHITETSVLQGIYIHLPTESDDVQDPFTELDLGLAPPASDWTPGGTDHGLLDFDLTGDGDWETTEGFKHPRMDFTVTNVDTVPVEFDAGNLWLDTGLYKPTSYTWEDDPRRLRQNVILEPGQTVTGSLYYEVPAKARFGVACYSNGDECVDLGGCIFGGCGGGARPRILVGRN